jgi:hypothetical protein
MGERWQALSAGARANWDAFAAAPPELDYNSLGELISLSGWNWYCRVNVRRTSAGLAYTDTVPTATAVTAPAVAVLTLEQLPGGACRIAYTAGVYTAGNSAVLEVAFIGAAGAAPATSGIKQLIATHNPGDGPLNIASPMTTRFGNIRTGWQFSCRLYKLRDDGVRSTFTTAATVVT